MVGWTTKLTRPNERTTRKHPRLRPGEVLSVPPQKETVPVGDRCKNPAASQLPCKGQSPAPEQLELSLGWSAPLQLSAATVERVLPFRSALARRSLSGSLCSQLALGDIPTCLATAPRHADGASRRGITNGFVSVIIVALGGQLMTPPFIPRDYPTDDV